MDIFNYDDYKKFLKDLIKERSKSIRGIQTRLSENLNCQTAYLSQVIRKNAQLSLDQAYLVCSFFSLNPKQTEYFLTLVQMARAGNYQHQQYLKNKLGNIKKDQLKLKNRLDTKDSLSESESYIYYSSWQYLAVHAILSLEKTNPEAEIANKLKISPTRVQSIIDFLTEAGLIIKKDETYRLTKKSFHLSSDSPMIGKHHSNWRFKSIESLDDPHELDMHYSSVISLSAKDLPVVRSIFVDAIDKARKIVKDSDPEVIYNYNVDVFQLS